MAFSGFKFTEEEQDLLKEFDRFKDTNISDKSLTKGVRIKFVDTFAGLFLTDITPYDSDLIDKIVQGDSATMGNREYKLARLFARGYAQAIFMGYYRALNSDRKVEESAKPEFGYSKLGESYTAAQVIAIQELQDSCIVEQQIEDGLLVKLREETSGEDYIANELYKSDLDVLKSIVLADIDDGYNVMVLNQIKDYYLTSINSGYLKDLEALYDTLFRDSFGVEPYAGMFAGESFITISATGETQNRSMNITKGLKYITDLVSRLNNIVSKRVKVSDSRQFDYDEIYGNTSKVVYFPYKMLEYALGRESTLNLTSKTYRLSANSTTWDNYWNSYVQDNLRSILVRGYYKALERCCIAGKDLDCDFVNKFNLQEETVFNLIRKYDTKISDYIPKLVDSLKSAYILTKYNFMAGEVINLSLRVTELSDINVLNKNSTSTLYKNLISTNDNEVFSPAYVLSDGITTKGGKVLSAIVLEYPYEINPLIAKAEPLFGYVIQKSNIRKGVASSWNNILIGQSMTGKELYAKPEDSDIQLQKLFTHNIYAGSRAGKGVMTMNILVSAVSAKKPIFYLDRKPDMASMLYSLSGGRQFIVNGGVYNQEFDSSKSFTESSSYMQNWNKTRSYLNSHPKILELFNTATTEYASILGDYIYLRAFMFCLGICFIRSKLDSKSAEFKSLNGTDGIVIVVDELTGAQGGLGGLFANISSKFVEASLKLGDPDKILDTIDKLNGEIEVQNLKYADAKNEAQRKTASNKIKELEKQKANLIDEGSVYAATFYKKLKESYLELKTQKLAGFKNKEYLYSDIFVLGQQLDYTYFASTRTESNKGSMSEVFFPLTSNKQGFYALYNNADIIRSFLEELQEEDWFLGRNPGFDYADKGTDPRVKQVTDLDGNWEYIKNSHTQNQINGRDDASFSSVLFKPYLVLNDNAESFTDKSGRYQYVAQCAKRVDNDANASIWKDVRIKHLTPEAKDRYTEENRMEDCLDEGVGFRGLVKYTLQARGEDVTDIDSVIAENLALSGDLANKIAKKMGNYDSWLDLIMDMSPEGMFSFTDMYNAFRGSSDYSLEVRLPLYAKLGLLHEDGVSSMSTSSVNYDDMGSDYTGEEYTQLDDDYDFDDTEDTEESSNYGSSYSNTTQSSYQDAQNHFYDDEDDKEEPEPIHNPVPNTEPKYISVMDVMHFCNLCVMRMGISIADINAVEYAQKTAIDSLVAMGYTIK